MTYLKAFLTFIAFIFTINASVANYSAQQEVVDEARHVFEKLYAIPDYQEFRDLYHKARGIMIIPSTFKASFLLGVEHGHGVLMVRKGFGEWSEPIFYRVSAASLGLQIGAKESSTVLLIMNNEGIESLLTNQVKLGADVSITAGLLGRGVGAGTTPNINTDIYAFSSSKGAFVGGALEGAWVQIDQDWNQLYYGQGETAQSILAKQPYISYPTKHLHDTLKK